MSSEAAVDEAEQAQQAEGTARADDTDVGAADTAGTAEEAEAADTAADRARQGLVEAFAAHLGDGLLSSHVEPGVDVWLRVSAGAWRETARFAKDELGFAYFGFLSAIDWLPSPYGRDMNAQIDLELGNDTAAEIDRTIEHGVTGGDTRFQVFCRFNDVVDHLGVTVKADIGDDLEIDTLIAVYPGADWHERECHEMYGISFRGHPDLRPIYLPTEFEGHPLRKDYPLLARRMKPWPGIVDVELMPSEDDPDQDPEADTADADSATEDTAAGNAAEDDEAAS